VIQYGRLGFRTSAFIIFWYAFNSVAAAAVFAAGGRLGPWLLLVSFPLALVTDGLVFRALNSGSTAPGSSLCEKLFPPVASAAILASSAFLVSLVYDTSCDGQTYHLDAVMRLSSGWNPFIIGSSGRTGDMQNAVNTYASTASWMNASAVYMLAGSVESAKAWNFVLIAAAAMMAWTLLRRIGAFGARAAALLAIVAAANPVAVSQGLSLYVDGALYSFLLILICSIGLLVAGFPRSAALPVIAASIIAACNLKSTGLVAVCIMGFAALFLLAVKKEFGKVRDLAVTGAVSLLFAVCLAGYRPYITNTIEHGNPFYPVVGGGRSSADVVAGQAEAGFLKRGNAARMAVSMFSKSENTWYSPPELKIPFMVHKKELGAMGDTDTRFGGFGPWFSGTLVLAFAMLLFIVFIARDRVPANAVYWGGSLVVLIVTVALVLGQSWWARYAPLTWLIPVIAAAAALAVREAKPVKILGAVLLATIIVNVLMSATGIINQLNGSRGVSVQLSELKRLSRDRPIEVDFRDFQSLKSRLTDAGINFKAAPGAPGCDNLRVIYSTNAVFCPPRE
jgi:hypothetical protein